ncbi:hypothetical protein, partial [Nocardia cyriacigeorgica]|uniref:hypothetical protein n=1 Tax=Nocardia cyriacigeorgica TaxID=135487 RepID=UPI0013D4984A
PNTIAIVNVPAQDCDWRPLVLGAAVVRTIVTDTSVRVDLEVCAYRAGRHGAEGEGVRLAGRSVGAERVGVRVEAAPV